MKIMKGVREIVLLGLLRPLPRPHNDWERVWPRHDTFKEAERLNRRPYVEHEVTNTGFITRRCVSTDEVTHYWGITRSTKCDEVTQRVITRRHEVPTKQSRGQAKLSYKN
ncbi:hypothetical protein TH606_01090 [Thermodesulfatator autotrophicus]|uniref:Uncharacterized protein n=1 Tax=Thermodesulfatator autotrophicus TaxID=1795632 RepID=A0A177EBN0_9BACT|nr:hypothetical protein TH606_01090 [Thermodesulfatator autotrophicus]